MAGLSSKNIKTRIQSMESTKQITRAMEMVAAAKLRQAQNQAVSSRPYFEILYGTINEIARSTRDRSSPYMRKRQNGSVLFVVIAGDRGLAGGYNNNVIKLCLQQMDGKRAAVLPVGRKALDFFRSHGIPRHTEVYSDVSEVGVSECFTMAKDITKAFGTGIYSEVHIVYTHFASVLSQSPTALKLLPLEPVEDPLTPIRVDTVYEPSIEEVFSAIIPEYLGGILYGAICESRCSEHAARRTAMDSATQNAEDMISHLKLKYNRARQWAITQEITEIVAGSNT